MVHHGPMVQDVGKDVLDIIPTQTLWYAKDIILIQFKDVSLITTEKFITKEINSKLFHNIGQNNYEQNHNKGFFCSQDNWSLKSKTLYKREILTMFYLWSIYNYI